MILFIRIAEEIVQHDLKKKDSDTFSLKPKTVNSVIEQGNKTNNYSSIKRNVSDNEVQVDLTTLASQNLFDITLAKQNHRSLKHKTSTAKIEYNNDKTSFLRVIFDNDIFDNTDYYYTNGIRIELVLDFIANAPTSKILPGLKKANYNYQGFSVVQNIYTPINPDTKLVSTNDRPFSAFLTIGHFRESVNIEKGLKMKSEFSLGVLGPASLGGRVQSSIHEIEPIGWQNQIKNDIVVDYSLQVDKTILSKKNFEISTLGKARIGTVYNKLTGGLSLRLGRFLPVLYNQVVGKSQKFKFWLFTKANLNLVFYDATLQGGLFNNQNIYTINAAQINRLVLKVSVGMAFYYKRFGLEFENFYVSPEFKGAYDFRYGRINLVIGF